MTINKQITILTIGILIIGSSIAYAGVVKVHSGNGRFFDDGFGNATLFGGGHTWAEMQTYQSESFDFQDWLDSSIGWGHNFMRGWTWEDSYYTPMPFTTTSDKFNLTTYNSTFFDRYDDRIQDLADEEMFTSVMLFNGWSTWDKTGWRTPDPWPVHPYKLSNNNNSINGDPNSDGDGIECHTAGYPAIWAKQTDYVEHMIDTLKDHDHIIWEIVNEAESGSVQWQYNMINHIKSYEAYKGYTQHLVWMTAAADTSNSVLFSSSCKADVVSPSNDGTDDYNNNPPVSTGAKIVIADSDHIVPLQVTEDWAWKNACRGNHPVLMDCSYDGLTWSTFNLDPTNPKWQRMRDAIGQILYYAAQFNLNNCVPQNGGTSPCSTGYCLYDTGDSYLCFQPTSGANVTVDLSAGTYFYEWYDTYNNVVAETGMVTSSGGNKTLTNPLSGKAALSIVEQTVSNEVSTDLGKYNVEHGLRHVQGGDKGTTVAATIGGKDCRRNETLGTSKYFYCDVNDDWAWQGSVPDVEITVDYYDNSTSGYFRVAYDGTNDNYTRTSDHYMTGTNTWKSKTWVIDDAYFGNRCSNDCDFRIFRSDYTSTYFYVDAVTVEDTGSGPTSVDIDMFIDDVENGLARPDPEPIGGLTANKTKGGVECRRNKTPYTTNRFFYFCIDDDWAYGGSKSDVYISYDYYVDVADSYLRLQYDAGSDAIYTNTPRVYPSTAGSWQETYVHITNADFSNRQAGGSDFRVKRGGDYAIWMNVVEVSTVAP